MYVNSPVTDEPYSNLIVPQFYTSRLFLYALWNKSCFAAGFDRTFPNGQFEAN